MNQYGNYMGLYMNQMPPINNPQQGYLDGYQNIYYYNNINSSYQYPTHMIGYPYFPQYIYEQPKTLEEQIDLIYQRGIVNNIIGALFIKEIQDKKKNGEKRKVPVATVELEEEQVSSAHAYIDAGADMVVGHHAHTLQGVEIYNDKPIIYNLGNFLFNNETIDTALFKVNLNKDGTMEYYIIPALQKDSKTEVLEGDEKLRVINDINSWSINAKLDEFGKIGKDNI